MYNSIRKKERVRVKKMNNVKRKQARARAEQVDKLKKDLREGKITKAQVSPSTISSQPLSPVT